MARQQKHSYEEFRTRAVLAAAAMVSAGGIGEFSARKLATEIGFTVGTLFNYFENTDAIIFQLNCHTLEKIATQLEQSACSIKIPPANRHAPIAALLTSYLGFVWENRYLWQLLMDCRYQALPTDTRKPYGFRVEVIVKIIERVLLLGRAAPCGAARIIWAGTNGIAADFLLCDPDGQERAVVAALDLARYYTDGKLVAELF